MPTITGANLGRPIETYRVLAVLEDAGAFDDPAAWTLPAGAREVSLLLAYQADGAASSYKLRARPSWVYADGTEVPDAVLEAEFAAPDPYAVRALSPSEYTITPPSTALFLAPPIVLDAPPGVVGLKVPVAEGGDTENPGQASIKLATRTS